MYGICFSLFLKTVLFSSLHVAHHQTPNAVHLFTEAVLGEHRVCSAVALYCLSFQQLGANLGAIKETSTDHSVSQTALKVCDCWRGKVLTGQKETTFKDDFLKSCL